MYFGALSLASCVNKNEGKIQYMIMKIMFNNIILSIRQ